MMFRYHMSRKKQVVIFDPSKWTGGPTRTEKIERHAFTQLHFELETSARPDLSQNVNYRADIFGYWCAKCRVRTFGCIPSSLCVNFEIVGLRNAYSVPTLFAQIIASHNVRDTQRRHILNFLVVSHAFAGSLTMTYV